MQFDDEMVKFYELPSWTRKKIILGVYNEVLSLRVT